MTLRGQLRRALHPRLHYLAGNQISLLCNGSAYFSALLAKIGSARTSILIETYLYAQDPIGDAVTEALCSAAQRGVDVRLVADGFGARNLDRTYRAQLERAGVQIRIFRPENQLLRHLLSFKRTHLRRMHRKMALIDGRTAFVGGINLIDDATGNTHDIRLDFAVAICGSLISPIGQAMEDQWRLLDRWHRLKHTLCMRPTRPPTMISLETTPAGSLHAALALRDNLLHRRTIEAAYLTAIQQATSHITLATAYFIPSRQIRSALLAAAARGVTVTLLLQGRIEYRLQHYASQALYSTLLAHGIRIFEYGPGYMHAKVAVVDGHWCTIGSANLDPFSLLVAREANIVVRDTGFAGQLQSQLDHAIRYQGQEITPSAWSAQPGHYRILRDVSARLLYRLLRLTGFADHY